MLADPGLYNGSQNIAAVTVLYEKAGQKHPFKGNLPAVLFQKLLRLCDIAVPQNQTAD